MLQALRVDEERRADLDDDAAEGVEGGVTAGRHLRQGRFDVGLREIVAFVEQRQVVDLGDGIGHAVAKVQLCRVTALAEALNASEAARNIFNEKATG